MSEAGLPTASPAQGPSTVPGGAMEALARLYADLDACIHQLGVACRACGSCCDFMRHGYRLYATGFERAALVRRHGEPRLTASGQCGFLVAGRCSARPWRPLGCRVFFCAPEHKPREQELCHAFLERLRALTREFGFAWDYGPLFADSIAAVNC